MNYDKFFNSKNIIVCAAIILIIAALGFYQIHTLQVAHSSFENYYRFRGCVELLEKTDTYATCKISSGEIIKIVKVGDKWFLEGDY